MRTFLILAALVALMAAPALAAEYADNPDHRPSVTLMVNSAWLDEEIEAPSLTRDVGEVTMFMPSILLTLPTSDNATIIFGINHGSWTTELEPGVDLKTRGFGGHLGLRFYLR